MIIGFAGTFGSGKDTLADYLKTKYNFLHVSTGDIIREFAKEKYGSIERPVLFKMATYLRNNYGPAFLVERSIDKYNNNLKLYNGVIVSGLRSIGEAKKIKELDGVLVYIDAPIEVRHDRMIKRSRDNETQITLKDFKARENKEMSSGVADEDFNIKRIGEMADITLINNLPKEQFYEKAEKALKFK